MWIGVEVHNVDWGLNCIMWTGVEVHNVDWGGSA
jgi:hypothetical protein